MEGIEQEVPEMIEQSGGNAPVSFDDLEAVMNTDAVVSKTEGKIVEKPKKKEKEDEENESEEETSKSKTKEKVSIETKDDSDEDKEETEPESSKKEEKEEQKTDAKPKDKVKTFKLKNGDEFVSLRADTSIDVPVNGQKESVTFQELVNNYSGKVNYDRKFSEIDKKSKAVEKDRALIDNTWKEFFKLSAKEKNPVAAINYLGELAGEDMASFWSEFRKSLEPIIEERLKLSPEERRIQELDEEVQYRRQQDEKRKKDHLQKQEYDTFFKKYDSMREESGLTQEQFVKLHEELENSGLITKEKITPEIVINYHKEIQARETLATLLKDVNSKMEETQLSAAVNDLRDVWIKNPELSIEQIKQIAAEVWGDKTARNLSKKLSRTAPEKNFKPTITKHGDPVSFDDI